MSKSGFLRHFRVFGVALAVAALSVVVGTATPSAFAAEHHFSGPRTWHVTVGVQTSNGAISGMVFTPSKVFVKQGDTIVWTVGSKEIHTVTFGTPPADADNESVEDISNPVLNAFEESEELFGAKSGGASFDGVSYYNSGLMTTEPAKSGFPMAVKTYSLKINAGVGSYTFYCLVHGPMMSQDVTVIPNSQAYPFTQWQYNTQAAHERAAIFAQGRRAADRTEDTLPRNTVSVGSSVDSGQADVMRFIRQTTKVKVNTLVTFTNVSMDPHTVTIGAEQGILAYGPSGAIRPGDNVSSGVFGAAFGHPSVTFTFAQPGVYHYYCVFHDYEGMVGTIIVTHEDD